MRPDKIYWIDALGAEFMPYLLSFFKEKDADIALRIQK